MKSKENFGTELQQNKRTLYIFKDNGRLQFQFCVSLSQLFLNNQGKNTRGISLFLDFYLS